MTRCLREEELLELAMGAAAPRRSAADAPPGAAAHLRTCVACAARLTALQGDLGLLRGALLDGPLPVPRVRARRIWLPIAAAAAGAAAALTLWFAPGSSTPTAQQVASAPLTQAQATSFAREVEWALFPDSGRTANGDLSDSTQLIAALNGGWNCEDPLGSDCGAGALSGLYE